MGQEWEEQKGPQVVPPPCTHYCGSFGSADNVAGSSACQSLSACQHCCQSPHVSAAASPTMSDPADSSWAMHLFWTTAACLPGAPWQVARVQAVALPTLTATSLGLRLGSWLLRLLRECMYLLLCSWCIRELLD